MNGFVTLRVPEDFDFHVMYHWCEANCLGDFYIGTDWHNWIPDSKNAIVQFKDQRDAILFALKWL